jgi:hypothetical protein
MKTSTVISLAFIISGSSLAHAQNTKVTGAESATSTTTNPAGADRISPPSDRRSHATTANAKNNANDKATSAAEHYYDGSKNKYK